MDGTPPQPVTEKYTVMGYADDLKPAVTTMAEFALVDQAARIFEQGSGCSLHHNPVTGKCMKCMKYMKICDNLSMVGVELTASWQATRKLNNDDLQLRVQNCVGSWKSAKFMPQCYNQHFFLEIKKVKEESPLNPLFMTIKDEFSVYKRMNKLRNTRSTFPIDIPNKLRKEFSPERSTPLSDIINACLTQQCYPKLWKEEGITPAPKISHPKTI